MRKKNRNMVLPGIMLVALAGAIAIYIVMLNMEKKVLEDYEKVKCLVSNDSILQGKEIAEGEASQLFEVMEVDRKIVPENSVLSTEEISGGQTILPISKGQVITREMFRFNSVCVEEMAEPVIAGVSAEDLYQVVNGTVRAGDLVNLYTVNEDTKEVSLFWEGVLVKDVFDSNGTCILAENQETAASRMNLVLEKTIVDQFYELLEKGSLRMVKEWGDSF